MQNSEQRATGKPRNRLAGGGLQVVARPLPDLTAGEPHCLPNLRSHPRRNGERETHVLLTRPQLFPGLHYAGFNPASTLLELVQTGN